MIGYKKAVCDDERVLVTLLIPEGAQTNINRTNVYDARFAKFRTDKAIVLSIEGIETGKEYTSARSMRDCAFVYNVGQTVRSDFDRTLEDVCTSGIHFFLTRECAKFYATYSGAHDWDDNGMLILMNYVDTFDITHQPASYQVSVNGQLTVIYAKPEMSPLARGTLLCIVAAVVFRLIN